MVLIEILAEEIANHCKLVLGLDFHVFYDNGNDEYVIAMEAEDDGAKEWIDCGASIRFEDYGLHCKIVRYDGRPGRDILSFCRVSFDITDPNTSPARIVDIIIDEMMKHLTDLMPDWCEHLPIE